MRVFIGILLISSILNAQTFQNFLNRLYSTPIENKAALVDSFLTAQSAFPIIESDSIVQFIYTGEATSVAVPGDANGWSTTIDRMSRIYGTNLWYLTKKFEPDARLDYKFVTDGSNWILDPRNKFTVMGGFGPNSELRMPAYHFPDEINYRPDIPHGTFFDTTFYSTNLQNSRQIRVYLPPNYYASRDSFGVILFHDGLEFVSLAYTNNVLDFLIWRGDIEPVIAVFVPPVNRTPEYAGNQQEKFTQFIVQEVMGWIDRKYHTRHDPNWRATVGASNGGNIALGLAISHPEVFGKVATFSSNVESNITNLLTNSSKLPLQFYLDIGTYDIAVLIPLVKNLKTLLQERSYPFEFHEWHEGHSWGNWRAHVDNVLKLFFGRPTRTRFSSRENLPTRINMTNYPNPFNVQTNFVINLPSEGRVQLEVYDLQGKLIDQITDAYLPTGDYHFLWQPLVSSGLYLYCLKYKQQNYSGKLLFFK